MFAEQLLQKHGEGEGAGKDYAAMELGIRGCSASGLQVILVTSSSLISHLARCSVFCYLVICMSKTEQRWSGAWQGSATITKI